MWNVTSMETDAGGGFLNELNDIASPSGKAKAQVQRLQNVVPVVVRQLRDSPNEEFQLFGMGTKILTLVGILREFEVQSTKATYQVEDHTGTIEVIWWLENDSNNAPNLPLVKEGCYLRVYGALRVQEDKKMIMVLKMFPVDNINEVTSHLLEVIHTRLEAENMTLNNVLATRVNNPGAELANSMSFMGDGMKNDVGLTPLQLKVFNILKPVNTVAGLSVTTILSSFQPSQHREVRAALDFLISEGHAYSTIDNDHFKVTESM